MSDNVRETQAIVRIHHPGPWWAYYCHDCLNQPGRIAETWDEALLLANDHLATYHPKIDWDAFDGDGS